MQEGQDDKSGEAVDPEKHRRKISKQNLCRRFFNNRKRLMVAPPRFFRSTFIRMRVPAAAATVGTVLIMAVVLAVATAPTAASMTKQMHSDKRQSDQDPKPVSGKPFHHYPHLIWSGF